MKTKMGRILSLNMTPAVNEQGQEVKLTGLYEIEDYQPYEPEARAWSPYYVVFDIWNENHFSIDAHVLEDAMP